ncbi:MAG TPA: molybdopterin-dependent oxidoreductase [Aggregatilineales bacterium]|nr:molybdopterin-dependent oxidoreductase [Anaerolineales bacterium]HRE47356.1 molybdopterin-dependent oxidoreductase [Aggregatilineales bacterium]
MSFLLRREKEEQVKNQGRLPPGQSLTQKFPVLHYGGVPMYETLARWTFRIFGLVEQEKTWSWEEFNKLPRHQVTLDIHCVTSWSKFDCLWEGIHVKTLVEAGLIKVKPEAKFVIQHCEFGYTTNTPLEAVFSENFLLATHFDGKPLDPEHGYPLRGLMGAVATQKTDTDLYLWKGGKWLRGLEFTATDRPGFWEMAGYSNTANVWREERYWHNRR